MPAAERRHPTPTGSQETRNNPCSYGGYAPGPRVLEGIAPHARPANPVTECREEAPSVGAIRQYILTEYAKAG